MTTTLNDITPDAWKPLGEKLLAAMEEKGVPEHCRNGVYQYILFGNPVGSFLEHLFCNRLKETFSHADDVNQHCVRNYLMFLYNDGPAQCYGSPEAYANWLATDGMVGQYMARVAEANRSSQIPDVPEELG